MKLKPFDNNALICVSESASQTKKVGFLLAETIKKEGVGKKALVIILEGDLGAGKTQFVQGVAKGLGVKKNVNSPTFVIFNRYSLEDNLKDFKSFYHVDCYRVNSVNDLEVIGINDILDEPANIVAIEWPDLAQINFSDAIVVKFEIIGKNQRRILINA